MKPALAIILEAIRTDGLVGCRLLTNITNFNNFRRAEMKADLATILEAIRIDMNENLIMPRSQGTEFN